MKTSSWLKVLAFSCALLPATAGFGASLQHGPGFERPGLGGPGHHRGNGEVRAYVEQNVLPVVRQQRQKLETQLAAADQAQLATYRTQLKALREQGKALRETLKPAAGATPGQRPALTDAQRQQLQQLHEQRRTIMQGVGQLATKYAAQINQLKTEVQPQREKWATDIKALVQKQLTPEQQQNLAQHQAHGGPRGHHGRGGHGPKQNFFGATRFLLLDPNASAPATAVEASRPAAMYPNPASSAQRLDYEIKKDGNVKVELLNEQGKTLRTVFDGKQDKGSHSLDVNLADLNRGTYYYKITSKGSSETRRFVKE
ncbi:T9SS type A sorting domain-containing protein [Hymenobacter sp. 15J16-1T3B]|uniref:T9SS type A sorting domain-containing protein n=1 Tax=Hymenobacter sp. 15J16-1T3B TaxID=2886941 RepID=UPI001D12C817|nr:T9SS type A sorting domain-containing protein [Hymenobacter sp. 15J16-1T3B]MCC3158331.1 T9SS type A sorting domain-containing protein [Hymenobacter sp. 15J16-1T3B]